MRAWKSATAASLTRRAQPRARRGRPRTTSARQSAARASAWAPRSRRPSRAPWPRTPREIASEGRGRRGASRENIPAGCVAGPAQNRRDAHRCIARTSVRVSKRGVGRKPKSASQPVIIIASTTTHAHCRVSAAAGRCRRLTRIPSQYTGGLYGDRVRSPSLVHVPLGTLHNLFVAAHASAASPFAVATSSSLSLSRTTSVTSPSRP